MTFEELGAALRAEREKRKLNIDDVADQLKISPRQLRALENGEIDALPHPAYARGFLRSYANWLGISSSEIQEALNNIGSASPPVKKKPVVKENNENLEMEPPQRKSHKGLYFFIILFTIAGILYFLWQTVDLDFIKNPFTSAQQSGTSLQSADSFMAAKDAAKKAEQEKTEQKTVETAAPLPSSLSASQIPDSRKDNVTEVVTKDTPKEAESKEKTESAAATPGQHKLIITAVEQCWVHSNADKTDTRQFSLRKGDTFALTFADSLELKLGNAGGVRLRYDGNDLPPPGTSGQVKTLTFPPKNN